MKKTDERPEKLQLFRAFTNYSYQVISVCVTPDFRGSYSSLYNLGNTEFIPSGVPPAAHLPSGSGVRGFQ